MASEKKQEKKPVKKSLSGFKKKLITAIIFILCLLAAGAVGFCIGNEDSRENIGDAGEKVSEVGDRLKVWGSEVGGSTKKLFD